MLGMGFEIREKNCGRALAQRAHVFGVFVKTPTICRHPPNELVNRFQVRLGTFPDFFWRERINRIERSHLYSKLVCLGRKRTDPARNIQNFLPYQSLTLRAEI